MCLEISLLAAFTVSPTIGGFIVQTQPWPVTIWWTLAPIGLAIVLVVAVLEETSFPRGENPDTYPSRPTSFFKNRIVTFLPGTKVVPTPTRRSVVCFLMSRLQAAWTDIEIVERICGAIEDRNRTNIYICWPVCLRRCRFHYSRWNHKPYSPTDT
jgi:MFS family permease